jgi:hypothetical protein
MNKDNENENILYLDCDCRSEVLRIEKDEECNEYYMSIYRNGHRSGLLYRLKLIWQVITTGEPYVDDICLNQEETDKMCNFFIMHKIFKNKNELNPLEKRFRDEYMNEFIEMYNQKIDIKNYKIRGQ